jgi:hypothetical protein
VLEETARRGLSLACTSGAAYPRTELLKRGNIQSEKHTVPFTKTSENDNQAYVCTDLVSEEAPIRNPDPEFNN